METFKVGDRVKARGEKWPYGLGTVIGFTKDRDVYKVVWDDYNYAVANDSHHSRAHAIEPAPTSNSYYDFPGGVEVRQISAHLTGFGAQALQYVARATRLDGKNKGDVVSDLTKAIDFIRWEIERLQGDSK